MSEESVLSFRKLVSAMRTTEKEYWAHRDKKMLRQSIELEKRVDGIIMKADRNDVPQNDNGKFFLLVAELRASTIQYFQEKKKLQPDKELVNSLFKTIKEKEAKIDKMLIRLKDEQIKKDGYIIQYHVMERMPRAHQARSIFNSSDEQLANIELNDHYRHPDPPGTMYFICKEYLGKNGKQLPQEELDKILKIMEKKTESLKVKVDKAIAEKIIGIGNCSSLRSRTSTWFECKVRYEKTQEDGSEKLVNELYVVDALSFTEAEASIIDNMAVYVSGELKIANINPANYNEIFFSDIDDDDLWFKARLAFITIDEKKDKEKRTYVNYLIQAKSIERAKRYVDEVMGKTMIDYELKSLSETKIFDVFEHEPSTDNKQNEKDGKTE